MAYRPWNKAHEVGDIYQADMSFNKQIGNCWMKNRLLDGDILLCTKHSGDSFHTWVLINIKVSNVISVIPNSEFGAYAFDRMHKICNINMFIEELGVHDIKQEELFKMRQARELLGSAIKEKTISYVMNL